MKALSNLWQRVRYRTLWTIAFLLWCGKVAIALACLPYTIPRDKKKRVQERRSHLVRICRVNGRVGIVTVDDYDQASRTYWDPYVTSERWSYDNGHAAAPAGRLIEVPNVVVLADRSKEFYTLMYELMAEQATFHVPTQIDPINAAYQKMFGQDFHGNYTNW